ncbi:MAG: four helix bundle protein [Candidatus Brachytrichaceae bacterium NZ_4S206]|jgi:four helix bundle protein
MTIKSYRDLSVWQKAMDLVVECYRTTEHFPKSEAYGLASQLQRAAISVPANIAEGHGRQHTAEYKHHLSVAYGSLMELETHIQIATRLGYCDADKSHELLEQTGEIGRMLNGLMRSLRKSTL